MLCGYRYFLIPLLFSGKNSTETTGQLLASRNQPSPLQTLVMQTSGQTILAGNSMSVLKQYPQCSGKLKLQLFPIDEVTQKGLEQVNSKLEKYHNLWRKDFCD